MIVATIKKVAVFTYASPSLAKAARRAAVDLDLFDWQLWTLAMKGYLRQLKKRGKRKR
jgi:hypothetical protein